MITKTPDIAHNLTQVKDTLPEHVTLVAVSKTKPAAYIEEAYKLGQRIFGENKVQELCEKQEILPKDIEWHMIGTLQRNKVKFIAPFVDLIHSLSSEKLAVEINKRAKEHNRTINCLVQIHLAEEETKSGFTFEACEAFLSTCQEKYPNIHITGLMAMGTFTSNTDQINNEFEKMSEFYSRQQNKFPFLKVLSMGMSGDYTIAIKHKSTMVRIGSTIFGNRSYN